MSIETATVTLNLLDSFNTAQLGAKVKIKINNRHAWYGDTFIKQVEKIYKADSSGIVTMILIETDTMTVDTFTDTGDDRQIYYEVNIADKYNINVTVPKGSGNINFKDLPVVT